MRLDAFDVFFASIVALLLAGLATAAVLGVRQTQLERDCLAAGYSRADWRFIGPSYCITRTDQTDVVVPVDSVRRARR